MHSSKPIVAELSAEVNGGAYSAEGLQFDLQVNSFPTVTATFAATDGKESVKAPVSQDIIDGIGFLQKARLAGRVNPDLSVSANDGRGGTMEYRGYISAPILELTSTSTGNKIASVGEAALLDALDLSIYQAADSSARDETLGGLKPIDAAKDGNVTGVIAAVTDVLVGNYLPSLKDEQRAVMKELLTMQHEINNNGPLAVWKKMLETDAVVYKSWVEAFKKGPTIAKNLSEHIKRVLLSGTPGFWNRAISLMSDFQMFYVPAFDGLGYFKRVDERVGDPEGELELSVSSFSVSDGNPRILQPGGVVMLGVGVDTMRAETTVSSSIPRVAAFYPSPLLQGFIQKENIPFWLINIQDGLPLINSEVDNGATSGGKVSLGLWERYTRLARGMEYKEEVQVLSEGILTEMCEVMFKNIQLEHSTCSATVPLDFSINEKIGKRWTVKIKNEAGDGGSFDAFLAGISHAVDLRQGKQLHSYTSLSFTHAKYA